MSNAQKVRPFRLLAPHDSSFQLDSFTGHEELSRLFNFQLSLSSRTKDHIHKPDEMIYQPASIQFQVEANDNRTIKGYISRFAIEYPEDKDVQFRAELVPWTWFLTQTSDCRIFEDKTIPQIVEEVFGSDPISSIAKFKLDLKKDYPKLEYCVQFRETDFNFVSRLLEQAGIYYFFDHSEEGDNSETMVLADDPQSYYDLYESKIKFRISTSSAHVGEDELTDWEHRYEFVSGKWTHSDHTFKSPYQNFESSSETNVDNGKLKSAFKTYEMYDHPAEFVDSKSSGDAASQSSDLADTRISESENPFDQVMASGLCRSFAAGGKFQLESDRAPEDNNKKFVVTSINHQGQNPGYRSGDSSGAMYHNSFTCIPDSVTFTPPRITPKPTVAGIQTATVVGTKGEEIYCDEFGRIKVLFHWARPDNKDRKYPDKQISCWIRVAHNSAGKKWGFMSIPRIGQEVVVDFLDGDPDRPLVVGSVFNSVQEVAYSLPEEKARTYFRTNSTPGGEGFNELMFDDKKDSERVFMHAQKDMDVRVRNDSRNRTYGNRSQIIGWEKDRDKGGSQWEMIYEDKEINVKRHQVEHIEGNHTYMLGNGEAEEGGNLAVVLEKSAAIKIGPDGLDLTIEGDSKSKVEGSQSLTVVGDLIQKSDSLHSTVNGEIATKAGGKISSQTGDSYHRKAGMDIAEEAGMNVYIKAGMSMVLEAGMSLTLKVGGNFINIGPTGVSITGTLVNINSGGAAGTGKGASPTGPKDPAEPNADVTKAAPKEPDMAHKEETGFKSAPE
ncbi:MAG: type VI secretion system tip protein TssI/VgrG [Pirellulaceae bacterium]